MPVVTMLKSRPGKIMTTGRMSGIKANSVNSHLNGVNLASVPKIAAPMPPAVTALAEDDANTPAMTAETNVLAGRKFASEPSSFSSNRSRNAARARCSRTRNAASEIPSVAAASAPLLPSR